MGHPALVHENSFTTKIPANVDEERFNPSSTTIPVPEEGSNTSISYFLLRCKYVTRKFLLVPYTDRTF